MCIPRKKSPTPLSNQCILIFRFIWPHTLPKDMCVGEGVIGPLWGESTCWLSVDSPLIRPVIRGSVFWVLLLLSLPIWWSLKNSPFVGDLRCPYSHVWRNSSVICVITFMKAKDEAKRLRSLAADGRRSVSNMESQISRYKSEIWSLRSDRENKEQELGKWSLWAIGENRKLSWWQLVFSGDIRGFRRCHGMVGIITTLDFSMNILPYLMAAKQEQR